jgi:hypothetical protein
VADIPADPSDAGMPHPDYLIGFYEAVMGVSLDKANWTASDVARYKAKAVDPSDPYAGGVRALWGAYLNNGPIPVDQEFTAPSGGDVWSSSDKIGGDGGAAERHVYFYDQQSAYDGSGYHPGFGLWGPVSLYVQIQGYSLNTQTWVLPRISGSQVWAYRYEADHAGPPYNGNWKGKVNSGQWYGDNWKTIATWAVAVFGTILSIVTLGAASAAMVTLMAVVIPGITLAVAGSMVAALEAVAIGAMKYAITGDSTGLMSAIATAGGEALSLGEDNIGAIAKKFGPDVGKFLSDVAVQVKNVEDAVTQNPTFIAMEKSLGTVNAYMGAASSLAASFPIINEDYWNTAKLAIGGQFTTGGVFLSEARAALDTDSLAALYNAAPWYAQGFVQYAATIRAAELTQNAAIAKALTGFHASSSYMGSESISSKSSTFVPPKARPTVWPPTPSPDTVAKNAKASSVHASAAVVVGGGLGLAWLLGFL